MFLGILRLDNKNFVVVGTIGILGQLIFHQNYERPY